MSLVGRLDLGVVTSARPVVGVRVALARRPWWRVVAVVALSLLAGWAHFVVVADTHRERAAWGTMIEVWVARGPHAPGDSLEVVRSALPAAVVPAAAVRDDPAGRVAHQRLVDGEIVVSSDLAPSSSPMALAPPGSVVVPVSDPLVSDTVIGAAVIVASEGVVLASSGVVVDVADGVVLVAVAERVAPTVAAAASRSMASLLFPAEPP